MVCGRKPPLHYRIVHIGAREICCHESILLGQREECSAGASMCCLFGVLQAAEGFFNGHVPATSISISFARLEMQVRPSANSDLACHAVWLCGRSAARESLFITHSHPSRRRLSVSSTDLLSIKFHHEPICDLERTFGKIRKAATKDLKSESEISEERDERRTSAGPPLVQPVKFQYLLQT